MFTKKFKLGWITAWVVPTVLAGCATLDSIGVPKASEDDFFFATDILHTLECELNEATTLARQIDKRFANQAAAVTLTLTVTEVNSVGGNGKFIIPVGSSDLSLAPSAVPKGTGTRVMEVKHGYSTGDIESCQNRTVKSAPTLAGELRPPKRLAGGLGLVEWVEQLATMMLTIDEDPTAATYKITFQIDHTLGIVPVITFPSADILGLTASNSRTIKHQLAVTVTEMSKKVAGNEKARKKALKEVFKIQESFLERSPI